MFEELLKKKKVNFSLLLNYGFVEKSNVYSFKTKIHNDEFQLEILINQNGRIDTNLFEFATCEPYVLYKMDIQGSFVGELREEIKKVLQEIISVCYDDCLFRNSQTNKVIEYIKVKYECYPEFLWDKYPNFAVFRRKDNKKWFSVIMIVTKDKLGFNSKEEIEIINLKATKKMVAELLKKGNSYPAYHMNKKSWYTVILDDSVELMDLKTKIDDSFNNTI